MELERELDAWAQSTYDDLLQTCFLDQGISREEAWDIIQQAKDLRREDIDQIRAVEKMQRTCEVAQKFEQHCKEIEKTGEVNTPEGVAILQNVYGWTNAKLVDGPSGKPGVFMLF
jgi:hypothetical protein